MDATRVAAVERWAIWAALSAILAATYFGFSPPYHHYLTLIAKAQDPEAFPLDAILTNSTYIKASVYYRVLAATGLPITHDVVGLILHFGLNALIFLGAVAVVRRRLAEGEGAVAVLAVLVTCLFYTKLVEGARATPISYITPTPSGLGHLLGMAALFLAMARRPAFAALATTLCLAVAPKGNVLLVPALMLWPLLDRALPRWAALWAVAPLVYAGVMAASGSGAAMAPADKAFMLDAVLRREEGDGVFTAQPWLVNLLLPAALLATPWLARRFADGTARALLWSLALPVAGGWVVMLLFPLGLSKVLAVPTLLMVSIPQSTKFFIWLFLAMALVLVLRDRRLAWYEKLGLVTALLVLRPFPAHAAAAAALVAATGALVAVRLRRGAPPSHAVPLAPLVAVMVVAMLGLRLGHSYPGPSWFDRVAFAHTGNWSAMVFADEPTWRSWEELRDLPDVPLVAIYENHGRAIPGVRPHRGGERFTTHTFAHVVSRKTPFHLLPAHGYTDRALWDELQRRELVVVELLRRVNAGEPVGDAWLGTLPAVKEGLPVRIERRLVDFLAERKMAVLAPAETDGLFPADLPRRPVGAMVLVGFGVAP